MSLKDPDYIQIDALTCRKRFHCRFESEAVKQDLVQFYCPECNALLWEEHHQYPIRYLRNENLINQKNLSDIQTSTCNLFSEPIRD